MQKTGRTEHIFIKIKPEIRKMIDENKRTGFNVSEYFEDKFLADFLPSIDKLKEEKKSHLNMAKSCEKRIKQLSHKKKAEKKLSLNEKELQQLMFVCGSGLSLDKQMSMFVSVTEKELNLEEFTNLRNKYIH